MSATEVKVRYLEDLAVGDTAERTITVGESDLDAFGAVSGDTNPVHFDEAYAQTTPFKGRIAHGMLAGAYISAILGTELPGPGAIYLSQALTFKRAIRIGDAVVVRVTVKSIDDKAGTVVMGTTCSVGRKQMVDGEAQVMVPRRPDAGAA